MFALAYRNLIFRETSADSTLALTATGTQTLLSGTVGNLRTPQLSTGVTWRSSGTGDRRCTVKDIPNVATGRTVRLIALLGWAIEQEGLEDLTFTFEIQGSNTSYFAEPVTLPNIPPGMARNWYVLLPEAVQDVSYIEVFVDGTSTGGPSAATSLTVSAGALWAGPVFTGTSTETLLAEGWEQDVIDSDESVETPGGQAYSGGGRPKRRVLSGSITHIPYALAFGAGGPAGIDLQAIKYEVGTSQPVIILPRSTAPAGEPLADVTARLGIYGRLATNPPIRHISGDTYGWGAFTHREML